MKNGGCEEHSFEWSRVEKRLIDINMRLCSFSKGVEELFPYQFRNSSSSLLKLLGLSCVSITSVMTDSMYLRLETIVSFSSSK